MNKKQLLKALEKYPDDAEVMLQERAMSNVHPIDSVGYGWYVDDGYDAPEVINESEDPEDFDIDPDEKKVIVLE